MLARNFFQTCDQNFYTMKKVFSIVMAAVLFVSMISCAVIVPASSPGNSGSAPGQVKKETGSKSAKPYAPGQQKKK